MKTNSTREIIDYSQTRGEKRMKRVKTVVDTIEIFVNIFDRAFEFSLLF